MRLINSMMMKLQRFCILASSIFLALSKSIKGDFIGWGNGTKFGQNVITYEFREFVTQKLIIAPHTFYYDCYDKKDLREMTAFPLIQLFDNHPKIKWVQKPFR